MGNRGVGGIAGAVVELVFDAQQLVYLATRSERPWGAVFIWPAGGDDEHAKKVLSTPPRRCCD
jgi:hypothetical protein